MAVPKRRQSNSRQGMRRAHDHLRLPSTTRCSRCKTPIEPHTICPECGHYRGKPVLQMEDAEA